MRSGEVEYHYSTERVSLSTIVIPEGGRFLRSTNINLGLLFEDIEVTE
jgi:hypothetical protein